MFHRYFQRYQSDYAQCGVKEEVCEINNNVEAPERHQPPKTLLRQPALWAMYTALAAYSVQGVCVPDVLEIMALLDIGRTAYNERLRKLREGGYVERRDDGAYGLVNAIPTNVALAFTYINNSVYIVNDRIGEPSIDSDIGVNNAIDVTNVVSDIDVISAPKRHTAHSVLAYWCDAYVTTFGAKYTPSHFAHESKRVKILLTRYDGGTLLSLIDVVMRLYTSLWSSASFPRPTLGQMQSWLAAQAEAYVAANAAAPIQDQPPKSATDEVGEIYAGKGWI